METPVRPDTNQAPESSPGDRLDTWKEIASYLRRGVRTVQRWEKEKGLPIHRLNLDRPHSVYAYSSELDQWWSNESARIEPSPVRRIRWLPLAAAGILTLGAGGWFLASRPLDLSSGAGSKVSLAVLPLRNLGHDRPSEQLCSELQVALASAFSRSPRLELVATDRFYDPARDLPVNGDDVRSAASRVEVESLLLGKVSRIDGSLQLSVLAIDVSSGVVRATVTASGSENDVAGLAEEVARRIEARLIVESVPELPTGVGCAQVPADVVASWTGDGSGNDLLKGSALVPQGTATFGPALVGQGFKMAEAGDAFHAQDSARWHLQRFTVSAWVRAMDAGGSGVDGIGGIVAVKVLTDYPHVFPFVSWALTYQPKGGYFSAIVQPAMVSGTPSDYLQSPDGFAAGEFHHVAMTFDGERLKLYVNGMLRVQRLAPGRIDYSDKRLGVGGHAFRGYPFDRTLIGEIDELEIVDGVLSASDIWKIYQSGAAGMCKP